MEKDTLTTMTKTFYGAAPKADTGDPARLFWLKGERAGEFFELREKKIWIGRAEDNDIQLPSENVSKQHALITTEADGRSYLVDHQSTNGTNVNGRAIQPDLPTRLTHGDIVTITDQEFIFLNNRENVMKDYADAVLFDAEAVRREAAGLLDEHGAIVETARRRRGKRE